MPAADAAGSHAGIDYCVLFGLMNGVGNEPVRPHEADDARHARVDPLSDGRRAGRVRTAGGAVCGRFGRHLVYCRRALGLCQRGRCSARTTRTLRRMPASRARSWSRCSTAPTARKRASARGPIGGYTDWNTVPDWAYSATTWAVSMGLLYGTSSTGAEPERPAPAARSSPPFMMRTCQPAGRAGFLKNPDKRVESFRQVCKNVTSIAIMTNELW